MRVDGCYSCSVESEDALPPWQRVVVTDHWRVVHAFDSSLPGWLVVMPREHRESLAELDPPSAAELGPLLADLTRALETTTGCVKAYVMLFAEAEGYAHLHFHVVPRLADQPESERGPRVFTRLGVPEADLVPEAERDRLAHRIGEALAR
jgi:diadenosine tetraphosphate (Ap4A) HIT family hydrolase